MKKLSILFGLTIILFFTACNDSSVAQEIHLLSRQEYHDVTAKKDVQLVDVRTPEEFAEGHLDNAKNINVLETDFITQAEKLNLDEPIYLYCRSGKRSAKAALILKDVGFKEIYDMNGGYIHWVEDGFQDKN
ncbi:Rhodanese-related sulfurtransferase [Aequorivita sublithincola DSM 14238]|uniref:Rhodanese-related sulfurtransferase n=1 Tax=Aequorivita sublithincola (strain DSM 14238 / LMG 21431 / ACAM 643 / 9-3) TaxID=746697 RepID=I3YT31_AEQSU|nr:rhodanese-like domain-containing protein [Aequorivita sublithincola]AFL80149.1 Rhodanese-related sulfurtransferase [Aequorivita sublithincola DSM 14238]